MVLGWIQLARLCYVTIKYGNAIKLIAAMACYEIRYFKFIVFNPMIFFVWQPSENSSNRNTKRRLCCDKKTQERIPKRALSGQEWSVICLVYHLLSGISIHHRAQSKKAGAC